MYAQTYFGQQPLRGHPTYRFGQGAGFNSINVYGVRTEMYPDLVVISLNPFIRGFQTLVDSIEDPLPANLGTREELLALRDRVVQEVTRILARYNITLPARVPRSFEETLFNAVETAEFYPEFMRIHEQLQELVAAQRWERGVAQEWEDFNSSRSRNLSRFRDPDKIFVDNSDNDDDKDLKAMQRMKSADMTVDSVTGIPLLPEDNVVSFCFGHQTLAENLLYDLDFIVMVDTEGLCYFLCPAMLENNTRCGCYHEVDSILDQLPSNMKDEIWAKVQEMHPRVWRRRIFDKIPDAEECPNKHCLHEGNSGIGFIMTRETAKAWVRRGIFSGVDPVEDVRECISCGTVWCNKCQNRFLTETSENSLKHDHLTCEEFSQVRNKEVDPTELMVRKMAVTCPGCKHDIAITFGCDHITCSVCHKHFCYICQNGAYDTEEEMRDNHDRSKHNNREGLPQKGTVDTLASFYNLVRWVYSNLCKKHVVNISNNYRV